MTLRSIKPCVVTTMTVLAASVGAAEGDLNAGANQVGVSVQRDAQHSQEALVSAGLALGRQGWVRLGAGKSHSEQAGLTRRPGLASLGGGWLSESWAIAGGVTQRRDGDSYRQTEWSSMLEWRSGTGTLGVDAAHRRTQAEGMVAMAAAPSGTVSVPVSETASGNGLGLHGTLRASERVAVFAAAMRYHNRTSTTQSGNASALGNVVDLPGSVQSLLANQTLLSQVLLSRASAVNRDEAVLDRSARIGATVRLDKIALTGEYLDDRVLGGADTLRSVQLKAAVDLSGGWTVTPSIGRTRSDLAGGVSYGGLSVGYGW